MPVDEMRGLQHHSRNGPHLARGDSGVLKKPYFVFEKTVKLTVKERTRPTAAPGDGQP